MQSRIFIALIAPLLLSGCLAQSQIQGKYMGSQEDCRNETARSVGGGETARPVTENQASPIAQRFSDCMTKEGWHLATPKPATAVAVNNPPTGSPSTNPSAALKAPVRETPEQNYPPASAYPAASSYPPNPNTTNNYYYGKPTTNYAPASSYPQPVAAPVAAVAPVAAAAPVAATAAVAPVAVSTATTAARTSTTAAPGVVSQTSIPASPDVATYQPGRPSGEATPYYGTGPGRQF